MERHKVYTDPGAPKSPAMIEEERMNRWYYAIRKVNKWCEKCTISFGDVRRDITGKFVCKECFK